MILGQKANLSDYSSSKWVVKQWRQLATSTMHLTQELLMNIQCSDGSRSFAKETTALKMSSVTGHHCWQWPTERIVKADPLRTTEEVAQELNVKHSIVVWHWKQTGKVITLHKWVPHELTENKKKKLIILKCLLLLFYTTTNHFSIRLCSMMKSEFYMIPAMTSSVAGIRSSFKSLAKAKFASKNGHGHCFVVCCLFDPLQFSES